MTRSDSRGVPRRSRAARAENGPWTDNLLHAWQHLVERAERGASSHRTGCPLCDGDDGLAARDELEALIRRGVAAGTASRGGSRCWTIGSVERPRPRRSHLAALAGGDTGISACIAFTDAGAWSCVRPVAGHSDHVPSMSSPVVASRKVQEVQSGAGVSTCVGVVLASGAGTGMAVGPHWCHL